ncbi:MAG: hypothetical protein SH809_16515 [Rhodothermales bacterium]|nr:hypothetical protein [Rhodothermales bacterium]
MRRLLLMLLLLSGCSFLSDKDVMRCPVDILSLSLDAPQRVVGTWQWVEGRNDACQSNTKYPLSEPPRLIVTVDSVVRIGFSSESSREAYPLSIRTSTIDSLRHFLFFDRNIVLLTPGDTLLVDDRYLDGGQGLFVRK